MYVAAGDDTAALRIAALCRDACTVSFDLAFVQSPMNFVLYLQNLPLNQRMCATLYSLQLPALLYRTGARALRDMCSGPRTLHAMKQQGACVLELM